MTPSATRRGLVVIDASARSRRRIPMAAERLRAVEASNDLVTFPVVTLERLYSAMDAREFAEVELHESQTRPIPLTRSIAATAVCALRELSKRGDGHHRVSVTDALIAAAAQEAGADVVHYDHHFDRLAKVLHFRSRWLAPAGR